MIGLKAIQVTCISTILLFFYDARNVVVNIGDANGGNWNEIAQRWQKEDGSIICCH